MVRDCNTPAIRDLEAHNAMGDALESRGVGHLVILACLLGLH